MDTASSPVSRHAHVARPAALLLAVVFVVLTLLVVLGPSLDGGGLPVPADQLLGPFRWSARGLA
jgi:hypothetical protein